MGISDDECKRIEQLITELHRDGKLPLKRIPAGSLAYRVQNAGKPNAERYGCPKGLGKLGRYNDPGEVYGVWYGAEHPSGALAEVFGREQVPGVRSLGVVVQAAALEARDMCVVKMVKDMRLLDIKACLSKLRLTLDEITGLDYTLTNEIVRIVARLESNPFDGLAYESRHNPDWRMCYALWLAPGESPTVSTIGMTKLSEFEYQGEVREGFNGDVMDTEEILTETLGYIVTASSP